MISVPWENIRRRTNIYYEGKKSAYVEYVRGDCAFSRIKSLPEFVKILDNNKKIEISVMHDEHVLPDTTIEITKEKESFSALYEDKTQLYFYDIHAIAGFFSHAIDGGRTYIKKERIKRHVCNII